MRSSPDVRQLFLSLSSKLLYQVLKECMLGINARNKIRNGSANYSSRFLWVDLQIREICTAVEEDGTLDRIPELLMSLPKTIEEIYSFALKRLSRGGDKLEQARNAFHWIACARRP